MSAVHFAERFGYEPDGVWSAPGRVNLIGEHTDYNEGLVLPFAIDKRTTCAAAVREDRVVRVATTFAPEIVEIGLDEITADMVSGWSAYVLGMVASMRSARLVDGTGLDLMIDSNVPVGAGLSSSAAIECATGVAVRDLWGLEMTRIEVAKAGRVTENHVVGAPTGLLDQAASMLGERDHAVFLDCRTEEAESVPLHAEEAGLVLLVIDSKVEHSHATGGYRERKASCDYACEVLGVTALRDVTMDTLDDALAQLDPVTQRRVRHIVTENERVAQTVALLQSEGLGAIGDLMVASHVSMRDDFEISAPEMDLIVDTAMAAGAVGARMTGGGFGGSAIAVVREADVAAVSEAVVAAAQAAGYPTPVPFVAVPSHGAGRDSAIETAEAHA